jgi:hypothetical protein
MIGNLLYLTTSRPNIVQAMGLVGVFQANPKETHVLAVKIIFRYLQGNVDYGLWYLKYTNLILRAYIYETGKEVLMIEKALMEAHSSLEVV